MRIDQALHEHLSADAGVSALVGDRVYPGWLGRGAQFPAVTITLASGTRGYVLGGPTGRRWPRFQVDCWARSHEGAVELADAVSAALDGFTGAMGTTAPVTVDRTTLEIEQDFAPEPDAAQESGIAWRRSMDFTISWRA